VDGSFANKSSVSRKAVSAILKIHRKLTSLAFLNPGIHLVAEHMMSVIEQLPKRGPYEGGHFQTLQTLMLSLSDERNISKLAASFAASAAQTAATGGECRDRTGPGSSWGRRSVCCRDRAVAVPCGRRRHVRWRAAR